MRKQASRASATAERAVTDQLPPSTRTWCNAASGRASRPAVVHRRHRAPNEGGQGLLRCGPRCLQPAHRRLVDRRPHPGPSSSSTPSRWPPGDASRTQEPLSIATGAASTRAGFSVTDACGFTARLDGPGRLVGRQHDHGLVLVDDVGVELFFTYFPPARGQEADGVAGVSQRLRVGLRRQDPISRAASAEIAVSGCHNLRWPPE